MMAVPNLLSIKYCPQWPSEGFEDIDNARAWVARFVNWYNQQHRHSRINYVTPDERHRGDHIEILERRTKLYRARQSQHPNRWSGSTRNWTPVESVDLNPEKHEDKAA